MKNILATTALLTVLGLSALAQAQMMPSSGSPEPAGATAADKKIAVEAGLSLNIPEGDIDNANASFGIRVGGGYTVAPNISVVAAFRYTFVSVDNSGDYER